MVKASTPIDNNNYETYVSLAGGRIRCLRCTAKSTRTKQQCLKPALKESRTQKCEFHGGRLHTIETLERISAANTIHGESSRQAKEQYRSDAILIRELEDALYVLKMADGPRIRGRKPNGYRGVRTHSDIVEMIQERVLHRI
jgi:hypothetical protein